MKKAGLENMKMGEVKGSSKLKKELFLKIRDVIPTAPKKLSLPFDVDYKVRQDALKNRLAQQGIFVSSMKYKSKYCNYDSHDNDKIGFPFFVEVAVFRSNNIAQNLYYVNALNNAVMPGGWSYLYGSYSNTFVWHTEADREKNNKMRYNGGEEEACHKSQNVFEIFRYYNYSYDDKESKKKHSIIAINLIAPKIIVENYGKSNIVLDPFEI